MDCPPVFADPSPAWTIEPIPSRCPLLWIEHPPARPAHGRFSVTSRGPVGPLACPRILAPARTRCRPVDLLRRVSQRYHRPPTLTSAPSSAGASATRTPGRSHSRTHTPTTPGPHR